MTRLIMTLIRFYLLSLERISPRAAGRAAYRLFSTPRTRRRVPPKIVDVMARAERFEVDAGSHRCVAYRWPHPQNDDAPRVLLVHGWESRAARLAVWVEPLTAAGFEVVAFDAWAHGESEGKRSGPRYFADAILTIAEHVGPIQACVCHSLGGFATLMAVAGMRLFGRRPVDVDRLVVVGGAESGTDAMAMFCEGLGLGRSFLPRVLEAAAEDAGRPVADFDASRIFQNRPIPTLWIHDGEDEVVPIECAERVERTCPHVRLERTRGLGHHRIVRDPETLRRGVAFLSSEPNP